MTCLERLRREQPEKVNPKYAGGAEDCPHDYGYLDKPEWCQYINVCDNTCEECWNREIPGTVSGTVSSQGLRLCTVGDETGYFHMWETYSKPLEASLLVGGAPAGVFSKVFAIVEFGNGVRRIDPTEIRFCDETNAFLHTLNKGEN